MDSTESQISGALFYPDCPRDMKPYVGRCFKTLEEGEIFYREYGVACGFNTRKGTLKKADDGSVVTRYVLCSKEGLKPISLDDSNDGDVVGSQKRRRMSSRVGCNARVKFRLKGGFGYEVTELQEGHTHPLVSALYRHLLKCNKKMDEAHELILFKCLKANIGPSRGYRLFKEMSDGYENVRCSLNDFKNRVRDVRATVIGYDAQILLDTLSSKREHCKDYFFDYWVDDHKKLRCIFWADSKSRENFRLFGDVVSFDATYGTNKQNMIFTPFTGKDNHGRCITFGAGLISKEDIDSYTWMLSKFLECMSTHPSMLITDQDPALKVVVPRVLPNTRHRFCIWHIMLKVADKAPSNLKNSEEFKRKIDNIVWSEMIEPPEFEEQWGAIMSEYGLNGHKWFEDIFRERNTWIPAFFRDFPMSGLLKTTSVSESENCFFKQYLNMNDNMIEFFNHFVIAIDAQRHGHDKLSMMDEASVPKLATQLPLERHAASVYTNKIFLEVQKEICGAINECSINGINIEGDCKSFTVGEVGNVSYIVTYNASVDDYACGCKNFIRHGLLCRHIFLVLWNAKKSTIPEKYILRRWTKFANVATNFETQVVSVSDKTVVQDSNLFTAAMRCIKLVEGDEDLRSELLSKFKDIAESIALRVNETMQSNAKQTTAEKYYGCSIPTEISVYPPSPSKTKGSGKHRKKSEKEKAIELANKPKRRCRKCNAMGYHDSRNCDRVSAKNKTV